MLGNAEKKIYVTIVEGRFAVSVPENDSHASEFMTKEGKKKGKTEYLYTKRYVFQFQRKLKR